MELTDGVSNYRIYHNSFRPCRVLLDVYHNDYKKHYIPVLVLIILSCHNKVVFLNHDLSCSKAGY